jgi:sulfoxide reductase heme-binding subunit YedZ
VDWLVSGFEVGSYARALYFFYGCVHFLVFLQFYIGWLPAALGEELLERSCSAVGFTALVFMLPLAITSTKKMQRRLGRNWRRLHQRVYPAAVLACVHLLWQARSDFGEALVCIVLFGLLLGWRIWRRWGSKGAVSIP